ncbi:hypothetical protein TNIN_389351 [Trichonephila inaurata madagascariensis]|uniref:Uncharacterized protein n=1 Tax=Trichonephila inaurata madagascariensis TaxID=2747483 RepID=A0A8X6I9D2_9ARAC|nr:hypothetical protein TNIN_389351 [Trichonephila inaurata madagascariensis]
MDDYLPLLRCTNFCTQHVTTLTVWKTPEICSLQWVIELFHILHENWIGALTIPVEVYRNFSMDGFPDTSSFRGGFNLRGDHRSANGRGIFAVAFWQNMLEIQDIASVDERVDACIGDSKDEQKELHSRIDLG